MDLKMRKSIKKIAATMLAATMVFGTMVSAFADDAAADKKVTDIGAIEEGQTLYTIGSAMTATAWAPESFDNVMTETKWPGVYSFDITVPAATDADGNETGIWNHRFSVCAYTADVDGKWNRVILGVPSVKPEDFTIIGNTILFSKTDASATPANIPIAAFQRSCKFTSFRSCSDVVPKVFS